MERMNVGDTFERFSQRIESQSLLYKSMANSDGQNDCGRCTYTLSQVMEGTGKASAAQRSTWCVPSSITVLEGVSIKINFPGVV